MPMIRLAFLVFALFSMIVLAPPVAQAQNADDDLQKLLDDFHARYQFPGATAAIILPNGDVVEAATGLADRENKVPMTPNSRMLAASIGKSFVAATLLALETDGFLRRTDLASEHLGQLPWFSRLPNHDTMTVDDLLRHRSGLPDHVHLESFQAKMASRMAEGGAALTPSEAIAFVLDAEPLFPAGSAWAYSDTGYLLLGLVIEEATGQRYYEIVAERFLASLGLSATAPSNAAYLEDLAVGNVAEGNPFGLPYRTIAENGSLLWDPATE